MSEPGLTSEQRAAIAVHNATQNRMCLNLSGNGQICVACSEVADQIDEAVAVALVGASEALSEKEAALAAEKSRAEKAEGELRYEANRSDLYASEVSRLEESLAAARRECEAATADRDAWHRTASIRGALLAGDDAPFRKEIANAETECETLREAMLQLRVRDEPDCWCPPRFGRDVKDDEHTTACMMASTALAAPAAGEGGKR